MKYLIPLILLFFCSSVAIAEMQDLKCETVGDLTFCEHDWSQECWNCKDECCSGDYCNTMCFKICNMGNEVFKDKCKELEAGPPDSLIVTKADRCNLIGCLSGKVVDKEKCECVEPDEIHKCDTSTILTSIPPQYRCEGPKIGVYYRPVDEVDLPSAGLKRIEDKVAALTAVIELIKQEQGQ